jgi:hypothetical protein
LTANASYTLTCSGSGGNIARTATVSVAPVALSVTLTPNPKSVPANTTSSLTWAGAGVTSCTASGGWSGTRPVSGTATVGPIVADTTYSLACSGNGNNVVAMTTVAVREAQLSWARPTKNVDGSTLTNLSGYKIHYGTKSRSYTQTLAVNGAATLQKTVALSGPGTWYFSLTAVDSSGVESAYSGEVSKAIP